MAAEAARTALHERVAAQAARRPDAVALEIGTTRLTYTELSALTDRIAARLLRATAGRTPHRVGLIAGRTATAYAGYLAAQRLGATVVPLHPASPTTRIADIARLAALDSVVDDGSRSHPGDLPAPALTLTDAELPEVAADPDPGLPAARPEDLAYILFTSGSTGVPKGVPVLHRNVHSYLDHALPRYAAGPGDRLSQTFDLTFDPSVLDLYAAWTAGATLVAATRGELLRPVRFVQRGALTHWHSVPSLISLARRLRALAPGSMPTLRRGLFCGEPLTLDQARAWHAAAPGATVDNAYGPTELTVTCTAYRLPCHPDDWPAPANGTVPIGLPYAALQARTYDGELCVRGPQRFPGYLDPADNAGRFLTSDGVPAGPDETVGDDHWYRTGDRVSGDPLGSAPLVHLGRLDQQVQVHGYRVELGEVEAALRAVPGTGESAVLALPTPDGSVELAAAHTGSLSAHDLRAALSDRLPDYMVPTGLHPVPALPLNPNGKIDRRALRALVEQPAGTRLTTLPAGTHPTAAPTPDA